MSFTGAAGEEGDFELKVWSAFAQIPSFFANLMDRQERSEEPDVAALSESIFMMKRQWEKTQAFDFSLTIGTPIEPTDSLSLRIYKQVNDSPAFYILAFRDAKKKN
jgi:hypothetical protein